MILYFRAKSRYKRLSTFILLENLASALQDLTIIEKKLQKYLLLGCVIQMQNSQTLPFICLSLGLGFKYNRTQQKIYYFFYLQGKLVNDNIPDGVGKIKYISFQKVLRIVIQVGKHYIIVKIDIKATFHNVTVAFQYLQLLGFRQVEKFYKKTCFLFGLAIALFILNFFAEALHFIIASFF